jgi:DNA-binding response OmpR family regulator
MIKQKLKILIVDDDRQVAETIQFNLQRAGYETILAHDGVRALQLVEDKQPDLLILDLMLPRLSGWEVCDALRRDLGSGLPIPILILSARGEETDCVRALQAGADDFLVKPYRPRELVARVQALLRRTGLESWDNENVTYQVGNIILNGARRETRVRTANGDTQQVALTNIEFELLKVLVEQRGKAVSYDTLLTRVWNDANYDGVEKIKACVKRLREKLEDDPDQPRHIITVRGYGFKLSD